MRFLLGVLISLLVSPLGAAGAEPAAYPANAYLDIEDGEVVSVFSIDGHNWRSCRSDPRCKPVGWPDNRAKLKVLRIKKGVKTPDLYDADSMTEEDFYEVEFTYERKGKDGRRYRQSGNGWIDAASVRFHRIAPMYATEASGPAAPPDCTASPGACGTSDSRPTRLKNEAVIAAAAALAPAVGQCVLRDQRVLGSLSNHGNHYDRFVLPVLRKVKLPQVLNEKGGRITRQQLYDIDALARMLYSETGKCFKRGLHHPMAIAKVAVNRTRRPEFADQFMAPPHASDKADLAKVATTASQFNVWFGQHNGRPNGPLKQAMCPPRSSAETFWPGTKPSQAELDIWKNSVRIATEAVLFPGKFNARTKNVTGLNYSTGLRSFYGMRLVTPTIEGRRVNNGMCVQLWVK